MDNLVLFPSLPMKLMDPVLKYKSRNGNSALPISCVNALVGTIPPDTVNTLFTKIPLLNEASPSMFKLLFNDKSPCTFKLFFAIATFSNIVLLFINKFPSTYTLLLNDTSLPTNNLAFSDKSISGSISGYPEIASVGIELFGYWA